MHTDKSLTMPVPAAAERKRRELFMEWRRFAEFAKALRLQCDQGFLETYERKKVLFPHARIVWPRRLEERVHRHKLSHDTRSLLALTRSKEHRPFIEFSEMQQKIDSGEGFVSPSRTDIINFITNKGHPISRSLCGELVPGVVQHPQQRPFRSWKTWCFDSPEGYRLNRAEHYYGWWQVLELYELERINLEIETPHWRLQRTAEQKRFLKGVTWKILHRDINPPTRVDFDPYHEPLEEIWPTAWSRWSPWIERAADFDWRSNASLQRYVWQVRQGNNGEQEWDLHLQRERVAAKRLTEGTRNDEWTRLLRALCRFEEHLATEERLLLRMVVHNIIHIIVDLLSVAFNKDMRQLAVEHDGPARQSWGPCSVDGETVRPWHLLSVLNENLYVTERFVRPFIEEHLQYWRRRLDPALQLHPDCATSFLDRLSKFDNEPLLLALAAYQRAEKYEMDTSWASQQFWAAIRSLIVATESETRRWFESNENLFVFLKNRFQGWQASYEKLVDNNSKRGVKLSPLQNIEDFSSALMDLEHQISACHDKGGINIHNQISVFYIARNWTAHHGGNPHPYQKRLGETVAFSIVLVLLLLWDIAKKDKSDILDKLYPNTGSFG
jgi:hypothetical protein